MAEVRRTSGREIQGGAALEISLRRWLRARTVAVRLTSDTRDILRQDRDRR